MPQDVLKRAGTRATSQEPAPPVTPWQTDWLCSSQPCLQRQVWNTHKRLQGTRQGHWVRLNKGAGHCRTRNRMTAIYPPACQGMERGEPSYWDSMVAGRGGIKAGNMYTEGKGSARPRAASGHHAH